MKQVLVGILLALAGSGAWADGLLTGEALYKTCTDETFGQKTCNAYIRGVLGGVLWQSKITDTDPAICLDGVNIDQSRQIFIGYLAAHQDRLTEPALVLFMESMSDRPCGN